ncbi:MAG: transcription antitermination factor NusB [Lachnospiraceae bacterium]|nr:transcription antitermination factor NusB [Lachnospiraceae bacterium]MBR2530299.1 transcription antitermination factor NusB [Lachnospiraceae bacterium]
MTRSLVREHLFKLLFRIEFNSPEDMPDQVRLYFEDGFADEDHASTGSDVPESDREYIRTKYEKIVELLPEIDAKIDGSAKGWSISRIGKVELSILRLAVFEMLYDDSIPVGVAIDEAVELSKRFGQDSSASFVNGILASLAK